MTVSLALRNSQTISEEKRKQIWEIAERLGYRPDPIIAKVMSSLRFEKEGSHKIAFITRTRDKEWRRKLTFARHYAGLLEHAGVQGYELEEFRLDEPGMTSKRMSQILRTRSIRGAIVASAPSSQGHLSLDFTELAAVVMGFSIIRPQLHRVANHQIHTFREAFRKLKHFGNRRVGGVLLASADLRCDRNWTAANAVVHVNIPAKDRVPLLLMEDWEFRVFAKWFERYQPDAIACLTGHLPEWLERLGKRVPQDVQLAHLDLSPDDKANAGINQNHELAGAAALDLLLSQLYLNQYGIPAVPRVLFIEGTWVDGPTAGPRK